MLWLPRGPTQHKIGWEKGLWLVKTSSCFPFAISFRPFHSEPFLTIQVKFSKVWLVSFLSPRITIIKELPFIECLLGARSCVRWFACYLINPLNNHLGGSPFNFMGEDIEANEPIKVTELVNSVTSGLQPGSGCFQSAALYCGRHTS